MSVKNKKEKHDGANVTNSTQLGGGGGAVTLFQAALERVNSRGVLETIRKLVCNCAEHPGTQFTCFTGTKVQILTRQYKLVCNCAEHPRCSVYLLYWYKSTNTDAVCTPARSTQAQKSSGGCAARTRRCLRCSRRRAPQQRYGRLGGFNRALQVLQAEGLLVYEALSY